MKARALLLAIAILPLQPASAIITVDQSGAFTTSAWGDCVDSGANGCAFDPDNDISITTLVGPSTGGVGVTSTMQTLTGVETEGAGTLIANATILGGLNTPLLGASATANDGRYGPTQALGAQLYTVTGGLPGQTINFSISLTGTVTNPDGGDATGLTATVGTIIVHDDLDFLLPLLPLALLDPGAVNLAQDTNGAVNLGPVASSIVVNPGDTFYYGSVGRCLGRYCRRWCRQLRNLARHAQYRIHLGFGKSLTRDHSIARIGVSVGSCARVTRPSTTFNLSTLKRFQVQ